MGPIFVAVGLFAALAAHQQSMRPTAKVQFNAPRYFVQPGSKPVVTHLEAGPQRLCTMPLLRPQRDIDPKIVLEPPPTIDAKIRTLDVPRCIER